MSDLGLDDCFDMRALSEFISDDLKANGARVGILDADFDFFMGDVSTNLDIIMNVLKSN